MSSIAASTARIVTVVLAMVTYSRAADLRTFDGDGKPLAIESVVENIADARAVFIGETHDRYDQHLSQLEIIRRLNEREPNRWAIGVEFIQWPFQPAVDAYVRGEIDEREFLRRTEYFDRWGYDFRLYRPIFRFAQEHAIPIVALNAPRELTDRVGKAGLEGLTETERAQLPKTIDKGDTAYRKRLQKIFKQHPQATNGNFEHFWEAQLVWDETMAERAADYLAAHPDKSIVVLAGSGHIEFGSGIPNRVRRRLPGAKVAVLIADDKRQKRRADYFLVTKNEELPPAPRMGITMETTNGVRVKAVSAGGAAASAGMMAKDRIVQVNGLDVKSVGDVRLALLDKRPGDHITLRVQRDLPDGTKEFTFDITLSM